MRKLAISAQSWHAQSFCAQSLSGQYLKAQDIISPANELKAEQDIYANDFRTFSVSHEIETLDFRLPTELEAGEPPEARGLSRDQVRLMVSYRSTNEIVNTDFHSLPDFLKA